MNEMIILTSLNYNLCFATVKYDEIRGMDARQDMETEIVIARDWDKLLDIDEEDIYKAVAEKFNSYIVSIYEIDVKYIIDGKTYIEKIDCTKYR